jgi:hypothetical protein
MTCYPLASYITGFCRATVGELLQHNKCYGITTDGFITPVSREKLVINDDDLCDRVQKKLEAGGFNKDFIGCDASGSRSLFLKTRGYLLVKDTDFNGDETFVGPPCQRDKLQKMAAMGAKVYKDTSADPVKDFLEILKKGYSDKKYFVKLNKIREEQRINPFAVPEIRTAENVRTNMTFDMKHLPAKQELKTEPFEWNGFPYQFVSFETEALDTSTDYHILRALRGRNNTRDIPKVLLDADYPFKDPDKCSTEELDDATAYFDQLIKNERLAAPDSQPDTVTKPKNIKTKIIDGQKVPQVIDFNIKSEKRPLIDLLLRSKMIPTYMQEPDYLRMLDRFDEYRNGEESVQLPAAIDDDDVESMPDEVEEIDYYDDISDE